MKITLHQTHQTIADFNEIFSYIETHFSDENPGLHLFPELFLCGYPLQDLCLQKSFITAYHNFLERISSWLTAHIKQESTCLLMGGLEYDLSKDGIPIKIKNVIYQFGDNKSFIPVYTKRLLPNYDIFDEKKYFTAGDGAKILTLFGRQFGVLICEDMWPSSFHELDPVNDLEKIVKAQNLSLNGIINLSASPFIIDKFAKRMDRAKQISHQFRCPFYYINKVGGEDEILFDGQSFSVNGDQVIDTAKRFLPQVIKSTLIDNKDYNKKHSPSKNLTWEELFVSRLDTTSTPACLFHWSDETTQEVLEALCFGFQEYATKSGFSKFTIALSGGMDSALVLTLISLCLKKGQTLEAIYMPSIYSSPLSYDLSLQLCQKLNIPFKSLPIKFMHSTGKNLFTQTFSDPFDGITDENIQSRLRGLLLYARSNQVGSMVVNTSNKSELAVGYSTQYGDSVGAISLLGDLFKSEVYHLAKYINAKYDQLIPEQIITREPTAELRPDQIDAHSLPPYDRLDAILEGILNYRYSFEDLTKLGFSPEEVELTFNLYRKTEYKRYQFCPIIKISSKSFGFGYRIPLSKHSQFYLTKN
ncbi:MAG: NAD(+) synthase [Halobacteriovoraceae bacterium]|jgi:NAD+ synthase (glutamine-hydrolysing)|nr:NAD(+) synthase [Halobacteriovoraceae bacterium]